jgi:ribose/xylose/arabinose/galactoside ABC-type transport system permease subunit
LILGAVGFVLLYLASDFVVPNLASSAMPLPNAAVEQTRAWFAANQLAAVMVAACQFLSVACLAVFVTRFGRLAARSGDAECATRATPWRRPRSPS